MYQCRDCGYKFETARLQKTEDEWVKAVCPECGGEFCGEVQKRYCRCCGAKLPKGAEEYCNDACRKRGRMMWERERRTRAMNKISPIHNIIRAAERYNELHSTRYSYGQFTTVIMPYLSEEELNALQ